MTHLRPHILLALCLAFSVSALSSCGIYSFTGTSIQPDVRSVSIGFFENKALKVYPSLSTDLTEAIRSEFRKMTPLEQVEEDGDISIEGQIVDYRITMAALTASEVAATNRLTITVKLQFANKKYPDEDFEKTFSQYADYDSQQTIDAVESSLCADIIKLLVEDIFNATVANW